MNVAETASPTPVISAAIPTPQARTASSYSVTLHVGDRSHNMSFREAFAFAHALLKQQKFKPAAIVLQHLSKVPIAEPGAAVLLAICEAGLSRYSAALNILNKAMFPDAAISPEIYDIIVQARMGFRDDALQKLLNLARQYQGLSILCLWLGDMYDARNDADKAIQCWKVAAARDQGKGAVALAASRQVTRLLKTIASKRPDMKAPSV